MNQPNYDMYWKKPGTPDRLVGKIGDQVTFADRDGRTYVAKLIECYDDGGCDTYVVRHDDGMEEGLDISAFERALR